jgi:hypothetical protein
MTQTNQTLRFLGYYEFIESQFVMGESHDKVAKEFGNPPDSVWQYLTYRLHPHLPVKAKPFVENLYEVVSLFADPQTRYKKIIIKYDDHSDIIHDVINVGGWMTYNHTITIQDVILGMIETGEINKMCDATENIHPKCNETESKDGLHDQVNDDVVLNCSDSEDEEEYLLDEYESEGEEDNSSKESESNVHCFQPKNSLGTVCTVEDVIKGCIFNAASCAMRYNKKVYVSWAGNYAPHH